LALLALIFSELEWVDKLEVVEGGALRKFKVDVARSILAQYFVKKSSPNMARNSLPADEGHSKTSLEEEVAQEEGIFEEQEFTRWTRLKRGE
jgi:hypothetical protein